MRRALRSRQIRIFITTQFLLEIQFWFPVWLIYLLDLDFSIGIAVLADAVFRVVSVACEVPMGILADRIGRKRTYLLMCLGTVVVFSGIAFIPQAGAPAAGGGLLVAWIAWGMLWALASGAAAPYLYEICERADVRVEPAKAFGLVRAAGNVAVVGSLLAAGYLYRTDSQLPWLVTAAFALVALVLALRLPGVSPPVMSTREVLGRIRREVTVAAVRRAMWLGGMLLFVGWSARILFQPLAIEIELSSEAIGWMYAAFAAAAVLGSAAAGLVARHHRRIAILVAFTGFPVTLLGIAVAPALAPFIALPVMGFAYALGTTAIEILTNEVTSPEVRAAIFSAAAAAAGLGIAVARPALGLLSDAHGTSFAAGFWALVSLLAVALVGPAIFHSTAAGRLVTPNERDPSQ